MFKFESFFSDFSIEYLSENNKHCGVGWVQVHCPFCEGSENYHLGFNINLNYWNCWRCGWHSPVAVVKNLLHVSHPQAKKILAEYSGVYFQKKDSAKPRPDAIELPPNQPFEAKHEKYISQRNFNPDEIAKLWGASATKPFGPYAHRILIPITHQEKLVSYQGRDITGKSMMKYKACRKEEEVIPHQECLYGLDKARGEKIIVVEGVFDVWRLGYGAVAVFGINWGLSQVIPLFNFSEVTIIFDAEPQAQKQARRLAAYLEQMSVWKINVIEPDSGDVAEMDDKDIKNLQNDFLK